MLTALALATLMQDAPQPARDPLTAEEIATAAAVVGLEFTDEELGQMVRGVAARLAGYERLRAPHIDNSVVPAGPFSPLAPGVTPRIRRPRAADDGTLHARVVARPADLEELCFWSIGDLGLLLRAGDVTCVELTETYLARLERVDAHLHCVISYTKERARAQARKLDAELQAGQDRGPLHGIPWGAKDLLAVDGTRTTWGAKPFEEQELPLDATVVQRLDEAGAVLIAKLTLGALAMGDVWYGGRTRNPWDPRKGSSGSSAGSASATVAGGVAFAIGSETLGSIVSPSFRCGNSSLRPTFGRVSRHGAMALSWSMDKLGPLCRSLADAELVFAAILGPDGHDLCVHALPYSRPDSLDLTKLKIGVPKGAFERMDEVAGVRAELASLGHELVEIELPDYPVDEMLLILMAEAAAAFDELTRSGDDDQLVRQQDQAWPNLFRAARLIPAVEYLRAQRLRTRLCQDMHAALAGVDLLVHPPYASGLLGITNLTGHPTVIAPYGERRDGSPYAICFTGQLFDEGTLLGVAGAWQAATGFHLKHPPMDYLDGEPAEDR